LVWAEYVKPYIDETFKRVGIEDKAGIYKITNLETGKCYIGKSTNIKKRLTDHFKSSIGIKTIAD
jgi:excinuclease UvrABC nuclease subunit